MSYASEIIDFGKFGKLGFMKILVIGGGGREHAFVWKIAQSPKVEKIYCAPGNAGIAQIAECVSINADDINELATFAKEEKIDLVVVGPEGPLSNGIVDVFNQQGIKIFGPTKKATQIESSKAFAKNLMDKYDIPTADGQIFDDCAKAEEYIRTAKTSLVVKADGLAGGKGVIVCKTKQEAINAVNDIMTKRIFGDAGNRVVIEERLIGEEVSFLVFTDGKTLLPLPSSQDHKAVFDNDEGPNTGGMGAYSPAPIVDWFLRKQIMEKVMKPTISAMEAEGCLYKGVLYAGLMIDNDQIKVLEYNARFGDPETQPLLMRMKSDIIPLMEACIEGSLHQQHIEIDDRAAACVVMASGGYPSSYKKGFPISGLQDVCDMEDVVVFHAGTAQKNDNIIANSGRVLGVSALGNSIEEAIKQTYLAVSKITWEDVHYRDDIGQKALKRLDKSPQVAIVMGSDSDLEIMEQTAAILKKFGVSFETAIVSAHRTPEKAAQLASSAKKRGIKIIIAGAGHAAHLAGVMAAHTSLPVIGIPIDSSALNGWDSLLSTAQMPSGIPVATMAIGRSGATNAGIFAIQILATSNPELANKLELFKNDMKTKVEQKSKKLNACL